MRTILTAPVISLLIAGCTSLLHSAPPESTELAATLRLAPGVSIESVGKYYFTNTHPNSVHLAPGWREIGYNCPDAVSVDGPPTLTYKFHGGLAYELYCSNITAHIRKVGRAVEPNLSSKRTR